MNLRAVTVLVAMCCGLAGCVTTGGNNLDRAKSPRDAAAYNLQLGLAYLQQGQLMLAREKIERALKQDPKNASVHTAAGLLYDRLDEDQRADQHFAQALRLNPKDPDVINNYGIYLCRKGRAKEGEELFVRAAHNPLYRTPELAYANAGQCMRGAGRLDRAEEYFEEALKLRPNSSMALLQLAELNFDSGRMAQSKVFVQRYLAAAPATAEILWLGVRVERALGNPVAAEIYAKRLRDEYPSAEQTRALLNSERKTG